MHPDSQRTGEMFSRVLHGIKTEEHAMPLVVFRYRPEIRLSDEEIQLLGRAIRPLVAEAASTDEVHLTEDDVDWVPQRYEPGAIASVSIEIRTIGYPARIAKLDPPTINRLRDQIVSLPRFPEVDSKKPLLWLQFTQGPHA